MGNFNYRAVTKEKVPQPPVLRVLFTYFFHYSRAQQPFNKHGVSKWHGS
jgi:hypothetical protein